jgi:acetyl esterase/lipase
MSSFRLTTNLSYSDHPRCQMDLYVPESTKPAPLVFLVHGGGWSAGNRQQYLLTATELAKRGYAAASVGYPLMPDRIWPEMGYDIYKAANWIKQNGSDYGIDVSRMVTWGSSAGSQLTLALHALALDWKNADVVSGEIPLIIGSVAHCVAFDLFAWDNEIRKQFVGDAKPETVSPADMDPKKFRSVFVAHSKPENLFPINAVIGWVEKLKAAGVDADIFVSDNGEHGYLYNIISDNARPAFEASVRYLDRIFNKPASKESV